MKKFKLDDSVLHRVVQIVQEAFLTGVDCADIMRQIELTTQTEVDTKNSSPAVLVLSEPYKAMVERQHAVMLDFVKEQQEQS